MRDVSRIIDAFYVDDPGYQNRLIVWLNLRFPGDKELIAELLRIKAAWLLVDKVLTDKELVLIGEGLFSDQITNIAGQLLKDPRPIHKRIWWWLTRPRHILGKDV